MDGDGEGSGGGAAANPKFRAAFQACGAKFERQGIFIDFSRKPAPWVWSTVNAQPMTCPDKSFSASLFACSACIFWYLRENLTFCDAGSERLRKC